MNSLWISAAFLLLSFVQSKPAPETEHNSAAASYTSQACGFELTRREDWNVTVKPNSPSTGPCDLVVTFSRPSDSGKSIETHSANLVVTNKDFESALRAAGLVQEDGQWQMEGRQGALTPTWGIQGKTWTGLRGNQLIGCFDDQGYSGLGQSPGAILTNAANKSALIFSGNGDCESIDFDAFDLLLASFEFLPEPPASRASTSK